MRVSLVSNASLEISLTVIWRSSTIKYHLDAKEFLCFQSKIVHVGQCVDRVNENAVAILILLRKAGLTSSWVQILQQHQKLRTLESTNIIIFMPEALISGLKFMTQMAKNSRNVARKQWSSEKEIRKFIGGIWERNTRCQGMIMFSSRYEFIDHTFINWSLLSYWFMNDFLLKVIFYY